VELILHGLGTALMSNFRAIDRETGFLLPLSLDEWLPEKHLARFVVEVIDGLDLSTMVRSYRGSGSACYHPALLLGVLVYGYATGIFSSRKLERATYDSVAFRFITANSWLSVGIGGLTIPARIFRCSGDNCASRPSTLSIWAVTSCSFGNAACAEAASVMPPSVVRRLVTLSVTCLPTSSPLQPLAGNAHFRTIPDLVHLVRCSDMSAGPSCRTAHSSKEVSGAERSMYRKRSRRRCR
jgi:hypothetical protein